MSLRVAVVANEVFDRRLGRMGGFGWAVRAVSRVFGQDPGLGVEVVLVSGEHRARPWRTETTVHDTRLLLRQRPRLLWERALRREDVDLILTIDFRPSYEQVLRALDATPVIVWVRDPRTPADAAAIAALRVPGVPTRPAGLEPIDCTALGRILGQRRGASLLGSPAPSLLAPKLEATYGLVGRPELRLLPNPIDPAGVADDSAGPLVVVLGRLDPYKRPWVVVEVARLLPGVRFALLGQAHFSGPGTWTAADLPPNMELLGHLDGDSLQQVLGSASVLLNTSLHEGLPVSFLEALAWGVPLVSCLDPEGVAGRFGICVGAAPGDGLDAAPRLARAIETLVADEGLRRRLGRSGREWVRETHSRPAFLHAFEECRALLGV